MGKLLKYEFRKTRNLKLIIIVIACLFEALFLVELYAVSDTSLLLGDPGCQSD